MVDCFVHLYLEVFASGAFAVLQFSFLSLQLFFPYLGEDVLLMQKAVIFSDVWRKLRDQRHPAHASLPLQYTVANTTKIVRNYAVLCQNKDLPVFTLDRICQAPLFFSLKPLSNLPERSFKTTPSKSGLSPNDSFVLPTVSQARSHSLPS